jgi:hypothetical protein
MTNDVSSQILLAMLNDAWNRASDAANSLRETLVNDQISSLQDVRYGSLASVGKNSTSQSYKSYGPGSLTQVQVVEACGNLLALYDQIKSKVQQEFIASADFDYTDPAGFDYDNPVFSILTKILTVVSSGKAYSLPDLRDIRIPVVEPPIETQ